MKAGKPEVPAHAVVHTDPPFALPTGGGLYERDSAGNVIKVEGDAGAMPAMPVTQGADHEK